MFYKKFFIVLILTAAILAVNFFVARNFLENAYYTFARPFLIPLTTRFVAVSSYGRNILMASKLAREVGDLRTENDKLLAQLGELDKLRLENEVLRTRLNVGADSGRDLVFANVLSLRGENSVSAFLINKGSEDGVEDGLAVVTAENILAGVVSKTFKKSSLVLMPQNKDLELNVKINGTDTLARSHPDGEKVLLDFITSQDEVKADDLVVTSGLVKIPEAIPVFKVTGVRPVKGNLFQEVTVSPIVNILQITKVFVIK